MQYRFARLPRAKLTALLMLVSVADAAVAGEATDGVEQLEHQVLPEKGADYAKALLFVRPRAEQGNVIAQYLLGVMYATGRGVPQSFAEAEKWYRLSALQGLSVAQYHLGILYSVGGDGVLKNDAEALKWFRMAADHGHAEAQFELGSEYDDGLGTPKDPTEAAKWYLRAANQGIDRAQFKLAYMYREGRGVAQDPVRAHMWFLIQKLIDTQEGRMTPDQIAEAKMMARAWEPTPEFDNFEPTPK
jgi:TPR repeat protein